MGHQGLSRRLSLPRALQVAVLTVAAVWGLSADAASSQNAHKHKGNREACDLIPATAMRFPERANHPNGMSRQRFAAVISIAQKVYEPIFLERGEKLLIRGLWADPEPNASAYPGKYPYETVIDKNLGDDAMELRYRRVDMYGGLARHPEMTVDGLLMVICHEIGHHLGGLPIKAYSWGASNEGQADYFASTKCMRRVLSNFDNVSIVSRMKIDPVARRKCVAAHPNSKEEMAICMRTAMAGLSLARVLASFGDEGKIDFATPDRSIVKETDNDHPAAQCRLDTYFQGSLCRVPYTTDMTTTSPIMGACTPDRATGALGYRPACWFHPKYYDRPELLVRK